MSRAEHRKERTKRRVAPRPRSSGEARRAGRAKRAGPIFVIGGREDLEGECEILAEFVARAPRGPIVVATLASEVPDELFTRYERVFRDKLGVKEVVHLTVDSREGVVDGNAREHEEVVRRATGVFFTGGSQIRVTTMLGGTPLCEKIRELHARGGAIAGTSAGASVLSSTMLVSGPSAASRTVGDALRMAPGLGLLPDLIIDQHFAERGRLGRLTAAVAQNPALLGVGLDEDTAIVLERPNCFSVLGRGAVYVVDGTHITRTNVIEDREDETLSVHGVRLHILNAGESFDVLERAPISRRSE
jgi:cyanophycinase